MASKALRLAAVLVLAASQTAIVWGVRLGAWQRWWRRRRIERPFRPYGSLQPFPFPEKSLPEKSGRDTGYSNTTIVFPQAIPQAVNAIGAIAAGPCHWNEDTFTVPSSAGGNRPVQVVTCR
jgi:hypothetical protein